MAEAGAGLYERILRGLVASGAIRPDHRVLVQFAGAFDDEVARRVGLRDCTFSNLAPDSPSSGLIGSRPADAHRMDHPDASFDHVIGHAGLHHCSRPHEALHEMYRIARSIVVAVENQDSPAMRVAARFGLAGTYEHQAVADGGGTSGGVDGTGVPNFVYRWTRREVVKTVRTFDPGRDVPVEFHAEWMLGAERLATSTVRGPGGGVALSRSLNRALNVLAGRQGNVFGFVVRKDLARPQPWTVSAS